MGRVGRNRGGTIGIVVGWLQICNGIAWRETSRAEKASRLQGGPDQKFPARVTVPVLRVTCQETGEDARS